MAAVIAHGLGRETEDSLVLVVDLGGGTYDVSLVECFEGGDTQQLAIRCWQQNTCEVCLTLYYAMEKPP